jgi:SAM-dependent methyltransferase
VSRPFIKRAVAEIYSRTAGRLYEPVVVKRAFPLLGGNLNQMALEQGRRAVTAAAGGAILDMPVGTAYFTLEAARKHQGLVVGADIAEGMVREAAALAHEHGMNNLSAVQADAHDLPFPDGAFAAILCTNGLQVIPGLRPSVAELARVLAPGGKLFVSVVSLPLSRALPAPASAKMPTFLRSGLDVAEALSDAGVYVTRVEKSRLATLIEALKPVGER